MSLCNIIYRKEQILNKELITLFYTLFKETRKEKLKIHNFYTYVNALKTKPRINITHIVSYID